VIEFPVLISEADLDIAQALSRGYLGKIHAQKLIEARECFYVEIAFVFGYATAKGWQWYEVHDLLENQSSDKHQCPPTGFYRISSPERDVISSRLWPFCR